MDRTDATKLTVNMLGDDSEIYLVTWHNVSLDDDDPDTGAFVFHVGTASSSGSSSDSSGATSAGDAGGVAALIGVLGLIVGAAGGFFFARRQAR